MTTSVAPTADRRLLGIGLFILAFALFSLTDASAKWLVLHGIPSTEVTFVRYAGQLVVVLALLAPQGLAALRTRRPWVQITRSLAIMSSTVLNFIAVAYLPLTVTGAIMFTVPLMVCALSVPFFGEHVGWRRWLAILVGLAGVLIIVQPGTEAFQPATLLSLGVALATAIFMLLTRKLAGIDSPMTQQFYAAAISFAGLLPFVITGWTWPSDPASWTAFIAIGLTALLGHQAMSIAYRFVSPAVAAPFTYTQIFWMTGLSWLVFNQPPDASIFIGAPIVIASGLYIWLRERQLAKAPVPPAVG